MLDLIEREIERHRAFYNTLVSLLESKGKGIVYATRNSGQLLNKSCWLFAN